MATQRPKVSGSNPSYPIFFLKLHMTLGLNDVFFFYVILFQNVANTTLTNRTV